MLPIDAFKTWCKNIDVHEEMNGGIPLIWSLRNNLFCNDVPLQWYRLISISSVLQHFRFLFVTMETLDTNILVVIFQAFVTPIPNITRNCEFVHIPNNNHHYRCHCLLCDTSFEINMLLLSTVFAWSVMLGHRSSSYYWNVQSHLGVTITSCSLLVH